MLCAIALRREVAPYGPGVIIHSDGPSVHAIRFFKLRIEGPQNGTITSDLLQVGDVSLSGSVNNIESNRQN